MSKCDQCGAVDPDDIHTCGVVQRRVGPGECLCKVKCLHAGSFGQCKGLPSVLVQPAPTNEQYTALEQALTRLQKRYGELEAKAAARPNTAREHANTS
jgi:hypothetical protein